jgi:hypothetical protein
MRTYDEDGIATAGSTGSMERSDVGTTVQRVAADRDARALDVRGTLMLQRAAGNASVGSLVEDEPSPVLDVVGRGGGQPLDDSTRETMENALGADLGGVRIHTDAAADASAQAVQAKAYTVGDEVAFRSGEYAPSTESGKRTLAHELTHVVQQRSGPVDGTPSGGGIAVSHPSDRYEQEAEASAQRVLGGDTDVHAGDDAASVDASPAATVQREAEDEAIDDEEIM